MTRIAAIGEAMARDGAVHLPALLSPGQLADAALEFCFGSHRGPLYNGSSFKPDDPADPFYKTGDLPRLSSSG